MTSSRYPTRTTPTRRTVLKGLGAAGISLTYVGTVSAGEDQVQYLVVGNGNTQQIENAGFTVERELADGQVLTVVGEKDAAEELRSISGVRAAEPDAKFEVDLEVTSESVATDTDGLDEYLPDPEEGPIERDADFWESLPSVDEYVDQIDADDDGPAPSWSNLWDKQVTDVESAHDHATGEGSTIAIIDTGIHPTHPDLEANVDRERSALFSSGLPCFLDPWDVDGHGTHVAGIAAAKPAFDDHPSVIGTAPDADLVSLRVFWLEGCLQLVTTTGDILAAIDYAGEIGADVANLSLGTEPIPPEANSEGFRAAYQAVIQHATRQGTLIVASSGNSNANLQQGGFFTVPNSVAGAMSISATGPNDARSVYSNFGTNEIDVGAPGGLYDDMATSLCGLEEWIEAGQPGLLSEDPREPGETGTLWLDADGQPTAIEAEIAERVECEIPQVPYPFNLVFSTYMDPLFFVSTWAWLAGTSMAAPQVAGLVALVRELDPGANALQVERAIAHGAERTSGSSDADLGAGRINALETVSRLVD